MKETLEQRIDRAYADACSYIDWEEIAKIYVLTGHRISEFNGFPSPAELRMFVADMYNRNLPAYLEAPELRMTVDSGGWTLTFSPQSVTLKYGPPLGFAQIRIPQEDEDE